MSTGKLLESKVLIVDDSAIIRKKMSEQLSAAGYAHIFQASDGQEALELLQNLVPDIFLVDIEMPRVTGLELIKAVRGSKKFDDSPILVITGADSGSNPWECFEAGADDFLRKPWDERELSSRIKVHLERKVMKEQLQEREARLLEHEEYISEILFSIPVGMILVKAETKKITLINPAAMAILNCSEENVIGNDYKIVFPERTFSEEEMFGAITSEENINTFSKKTIPVITTRIDVKLSGKTTVLLCFVDISDRKATEKQLEMFANQMEKLAENRAEQLIHADRLVTLGTMSAGIAHEINNPLNYISANTQMFQQVWGTIDKMIEHCADKEICEPKEIKLLETEGRDMLEGIRKGVSRITTIIDGLKFFSRKETGEKHAMDIKKCVNDALMICQNKIKYTLEVEQTIEEDLPKLHINAQQIEQVFINIINNAADAIGKHGKLSITVEKDEEYVNIYIDNDGSPIPLDKIEEIWQPFYTTKGIETGTGLGLSICRGIINDHGGRITAEASGPLGGARFLIELPI